MFIRTVRKLNVKYEYYMDVNYKTEPMVDKIKIIAPIFVSNVYKNFKFDQSYFRYVEGVKCKILSGYLRKKPTFFGCETKRILKYSSGFALQGIFHPCWTGGKNLRFSLSRSLRLCTLLNSARNTLKQKKNGLLRKNDTLYFQHIRIWVITI